MSAARKSPSKASAKQNAARKKLITIIDEVADVGVAAGVRLSFSITFTPPIEEGPLLDRLKAVLARVAQEDRIERLRVGGADAEGMPIDGEWERSRDAS